MIIELSYPHKDLMPNRKNGSHWAKTIDVKKSAIKEAFTIAFNASRTCKQLRTGTLPLNIIFMQSDKRKRDLDNLLAASKPAIDGIAQALGIDDKQFEPITIMRGYGDVSKMIVTISEI